MKDKKSNDLRRVEVLVYCVLLFNTIFFSSSLALFPNLIPDYCVEPEKICPNKNITFYLYTSDSPTEPKQLNITDPNTIIQAPFILGAPLKFLLHGYTGYVDYAPNPQLRDAYFRRSQPINIISIDYGPLVLDGCYIPAVANTDLVANCTAQFLDTLLDLREDIKLENLHIIGLSLGAQVAGQIHNYFRHGRFKRITGLDPAAPFFYAEIRNDDRMLSADDADFVDVLHTNAGLKGKLLPIGHIDFYANLGVFQPGCGLNTSCSHERSVEYYAEAINSDIGFWGYNCSDVLTFIIGRCLNSPHSWNVLGENTDPKVPGTFFFSTNAKFPFARGKNVDE